MSFVRFAFDLVVHELSSDSPEIFSPVLKLKLEIRFELRVSEPALLKPSLPPTTTPSSHCAAGSRKRIKSSRDG